MLEEVRNRWDGTRYDLGNHNCNFFTDDLLKSLGSPGLDQEYLKASGLAKGLSQVPGSSLVQEVLVKWPISDKRLDKAFMDDLEKLARLPGDTFNEVKRFLDRVGVTGSFGEFRLPGGISWPHF